MTSNGELPTSSEAASPDEWWRERLQEVAASGRTAEGDLLLIGSDPAGRAAALDRLEAAASAARFTVVRLRAQPGHPLVRTIADGLDDIQSPNVFTPPDGSERPLRLSERIELTSDQLHRERQSGLALLVDDLDRADPDSVQVLLGTLSSLFFVAGQTACLFAFAGGPDVTTVITNDKISDLDRFHQCWLDGEQ